MVLVFVFLLQMFIFANCQNPFENGVNIVSNGLDAGMDVTQQWIKFQTDFVKNYTTAEIPRRFEIFKRNLQMIQEHNQKFLQGLHTFKTALNKFADLTKEEFVETLKLKPPRRYKRNVNGKMYKKKSRTRRQLPDSVDWRNMGAVAPVKNQGNCGSCWSFSAIGALEGQLYLKAGQGIPLSEQNLIDCNIDSTNMGCKGGWISNAYDYLRSHFVTAEFEYPYQETQQICKQEGVYNTKVSITGYQILSGTEDALKEAVASIGPIAAALDGSNLQFYDGGVYRDEDCTFSNKVNHGVVVIGYGSESGKDYWLVKNSWGSDWGENGYFKIIRNKQNQCNLATYAMYPTLG